MSQLFGARWPKMKAHMREFSADFGITDMGHAEHMPNTRKALALSEWARDLGKVDAFREAAMDAYWRRGKDLGDDATLVALAEQVGLDAAGARKAMVDPALQARVDANRREGLRRGVSGIPTFFFGDVKVVGCQSFEELAEAAELAGAKRKN